MNIGKNFILIAKQRTTLNHLNYLIWTSMRQRNVKALHKKASWWALRCMLSSFTAFRLVLQKMRDGMMDDEAVDFLLKRCFEQLSPEDQELFWKEAIFIMQTWARTKSITLQYLQNIGNPIIIVHADASGVKHP
jgi:hypothetical protein